MQTLVVGGTRFLGRAVVDRLIESGHDVTMFNRGRTNPGLYPDVARVTGDRDGDLGALRSLTFDAVIDTCAYFPRQIHSMVDELGEIGHYTFVSSISVYADHSTPAGDESGELETVDDPAIEELGERYGGFKALCEHAVDDRLPGRGHHVRAGLIVGPHDNTDRFTYWVRRLAEGGDVLAPRPPDQAVQMIDVRDLASWIVHAAEQRVAGAMNAVSPPDETTLQSMLGDIVQTLGTAPTLHWVDERFLADHAVEPWSDLPLWLPPTTMPGHAGFLRRSVERARSHGLRTRPLRDTIAALRDWLADGGDAGIERTGLHREREAALLSEWWAGGHN